MCLHLITINNKQTSSLYNALSVVLDNIVLFEYKTKEGGSERPQYQNMNNHNIKILIYE